MVQVPLTILHSHYPELIRDLAELAESTEVISGIWFGEHRGPGAIRNPILAAATAGALTQSVRVGTAGILAAAGIPYRVAEDATALAATTDDRFDLGLVSATPCSALLAQLKGPDSNELRIEEIVELTVACVRGETSFEPGVPDPASEHSTAPPIWLCGQRIETALLAARLGLNFAFHAYWCQLSKEIDAEEVVAAYRSEFRPVRDNPCSRLAVAFSGSVSANRNKAMRVWDEGIAAGIPAGQTRSITLPPPNFLGGADECSERLVESQRQFGADEVVVRCLTRGPEHLLETYRVLCDSYERNAESQTGQRATRLRQSECR